MNCNYYITFDDDGNAKYIITVDVVAEEIQTMTSEEVGAAIKDAISSPPVQI